jgi:hypothetical protein
MDDAEINRTYQEMLLAAKEKPVPDIDDADILPNVADDVDPTRSGILQREDALNEAGIDTEMMDDDEILATYQQMVADRKAAARNKDVLGPDEGATAARTQDKIDALEEAGIDTSGMTPNEIRLAHTQLVMEQNFGPGQLRQQPFQSAPKPRKATGANNQQPKQQPNTNATGKQPNPTKNNSTPTTPTRTWGEYFGEAPFSRAVMPLSVVTLGGLGLNALFNTDSDPEVTPVDFPEQPRIPIPENISEEGFDGEAPAPGRAVGPDPALIQRIQQQQSRPVTMGGFNNVSGKRYWRRHT